MTTIMTHCDGVLTLSECEGKTCCLICGKSFKSMAKRHEHVLKEHPITCKMVKDLSNKFCLGLLDEKTSERIWCHIENCKRCNDFITSSGLPSRQN